MADVIQEPPSVQSEKVAKGEVPRDLSETEKAEIAAPGHAE